jgi:hypothetical protein
MFETSFIFAFINGPHCSFEIVQAVARRPKRGSAVGRHFPSKKRRNVEAVVGAATRHIRNIRNIRNSA